MSGNEGCLGPYATEASFPYVRGVAARGSCAMRTMDRGRPVSKANFAATGNRDTARKNEAGVQRRRNVGDAGEP